MGLDEKILGATIYAVRKKYSGLTAPQLIAQYGTIENAQLTMAIEESAAIILHFKTLGVVNVAVETAGTALAQVGTGVGTIQ